MTGRATEELVAKYMAGPGAEGESLEFKGKEKAETNEGRRDLAKIVSAMANTRGGTIVVGVGPPNTGRRLESFDERSEAVRDLSNVIRDNVRPFQEGLVELRFDTIPPGVRLLRIDVQESDRLLEFNTGSRGYVPSMRVHDTTLEMTSSDIAEFHRRRRQVEAITWLRELVRVNVDTVRDVPRPMLRSKQRRLLTHGSEDHLTIPVDTIPMGYGTRPFYHTESDFEARTAEELLAKFKVAFPCLGVPVDDSLRYVIEDGGRLLYGATLKDLADDLTNFEKTLGQFADVPLGGGSRKDDPTDYRPQILVTAPTWAGTLWVAFEHRFRPGFIRNEVGLVMEHIPIDSSDITRFFKKMGTQPGWLQQESAPHLLKIVGEVEIRNIVPVVLHNLDEFATHLFADNPFFGREREIRKASEQPIPRGFLDGICAAERIIVGLRGGYNPAWGLVYLQHLELLNAPTVMDTTFYDAFAYQR